MGWRETITVCRMNRKMQNPERILSNNNPNFAALILLKEEKTLLVVNFALQYKWQLERSLAEINFTIYGEKDKIEQEEEEEEEEAYLWSVQKRPNFPAVIKNPEDAIISPH